MLTKFPAFAACVVFALAIRPATAQQSIAETVAQLKADVTNLQHGMPVASPTSTSSPTFNNIEFGSGFATFKNTNSASVAFIGNAADGSGGLWGKNNLGNRIFALSTATGTDRGSLELDSNGTQSISLQPLQNGSGVAHFLASNGKDQVSIGGTVQSSGGAAWFNDNAGKNLVFVGASTTGLPRVSMRHPDGTDVITLQDVGGGSLTINNTVGKQIVNISALTNEGGGASFSDSNGEDVAKIGAFNGDTSKGTVWAKGNDYAELFDAAGDAQTSAFLPGSVVAVSADGRGIVLAATASDPAVVGVLSGAGGLHPAMVVGGSPEASIPPVAIAGQVYVRIKTENGPIHVGDLLVSSSTPGVAMRSMHPAESVGAIIGKALQNYSTPGEGYIRMLVLNR